jgi:hypothetical protein
MFQQLPSSLFTSLAKLVFNSVSQSKSVSATPLSRQTNVSPSNDNAQPDHFLLQKDELASCPVLSAPFDLPPVLNTTLCAVCGTFKTGRSAAAHFPLPHSLNSCTSFSRSPIFPLNHLQYSTTQTE